MEEKRFQSENVESHTNIDTHRKQNRSTDSEEDKELIEFWNRTTEIFTEQTHVLIDLASIEAVTYGEVIHRLQKMVRFLPFERTSREIGIGIISQAVDIVRKQAEDNTIKK